MVGGFAGRALVELVLTGATCGVLGVQVVLRRLGFFAESLGHVTFLGIVVAVILGADITVGAGVAAPCAVAVMSRAGLASRRHHHYPAIMVSGALALGVVLIAARPGFSKDLTAALVGSPLTVGSDDIAAAAVVAVLVATVLALGHKELTLAAFDPVVARALGYPAWVIDGGLLALIALTVVAATPAVGATLPLALLIGPAAAAVVWTRRLIPATLLGGASGATCSAAGLALSVHYRLATAATVAVLCGSLLASAAATGRRGDRARPAPATGL
jgi:ABC-type Mn2+/Zn2+ transport system permease subunit